MTAYSSGAVACAEEHGSQKATVSIKGFPQMSVDLRCAWADRYALVQDIVGGMRAWPHGGWVVPPQAISATIAPASGTAFDEDGEACAYEQAIVSVTYSHEATDLVSESIEPATRFQTLDEKDFLWDAGKKPLLQAEAPGRLVHDLNLSRTLFNRTPPVSTDLLTLPGTVNHTVYVSALLGLSFAAETLLFMPGKLTRTIKTDGSGGINIDLKWSFKNEGWNTYWRTGKPGGPGYDRLVLKSDPGTTYESYPLADHSAFLF